MHKLLALLTFVFLIVSCTSKVVVHPPEAIHYPNMPPLQSHIGASTVALVAQTSDDDQYLHAYCTGAWVSPTEILTVAHCVQAYVEHNSTKEHPLHLIGTTLQYISETDVIAVGVQPKRSYNAVSERLDLVHDLALLKATGDEPTHSFVSLAQETPYISQRVYTVGNPGGNYFRYLEGYVSTYRLSVPGDDFTGPYLEAAFPIAGGCSGGGVFNEKGELVAVAEAMSVKVPMLAYCVHLNTVQDFLHPPVSVPNESQVHK